MTVHAADDFTEIARRRLEIRREEGRTDDDARTAVGGDLDAVAAGIGLARLGYESDDALRQRVMALLVDARA